MLGTSTSVVTLAKKMAKPDTKTLIRTVSIAKTKVTKQPVQQPSKSTKSSAVLTATKPIAPKKPLPNQQANQ